jgi:cytochrome P450
VGNLYKFTFWLVSHLVHNAVLLEQVREEVLPAVRGEEVDEKYLIEKCPKLNALVSETLRLTVTSSLARVIVEPTMVGGKMLKPGNKIMVCLHHVLCVVALLTLSSCPFENCITTARYGAKAQRDSNLAGS